MAYQPPPVPRRLVDPWLGPVPGGDGTPGATMDATPILCYRIGGAPGSLTVEAMANIECLVIRVADGGRISTASFRYRFNTGLVGAPNSTEEALSTAFTGAKVVHPGDMLAVQAIAPLGNRSWMFWGHAGNFAMQLGPDGEDVIISCLGVEARTRDAAIGGMMMRKASTPSTPRAGGGASNDVATEIPATFNPHGVANATPPGANSGTEPASYPAFLDPTIKVGTTPVAQPWDLAMAARYLCFREGTPADGSTPWVSPPRGPDLDALLIARQPRDPNAGTFDPNDVATYTPAPILCPDFPITGKAWPEALAALLAGRGFGMKWQLAADEDGKPVVSLVPYLLAAGAATPKDLWLTYGPFDPATTNLQAAGLARDVAEVVTDWEVEGAPLAFEGSFTLAPGFPMSPADAADTVALAKYDANSLDFLGNEDAYRLFVLDEAGQGHYAPGETAIIRAVPDLGAVLGTHAGDFVVRQRPPIGDLFTAGPDGGPLEAQLSISTDYAGPAPGAWNGSGTWQTVESGWALLRDRIGIRVTEHNPDAWDLGKPAAGAPPVATGVLKVVKALAAPDAANPKFTLMLTCVIEGDKLLRGGTPNKSFRPPVPWTAIRRVDAADRYRLDTIAAHSQFNESADPVIARDDTKAATAEAYALRAATEVGTLEGSATIPYFTANYFLGDNVRSIQGRGLGLRTDGGGSQDVPSYPVVTAIEWHLGGDVQRTTLELSDARGLPPEPSTAKPGLRAARPPGAGAMQGPDAARAQAGMVAPGTNAATGRDLPAAPLPARPTFRMKGPRR